jgi:hypothetical protein
MGPYAGVDHNLILCPLQSRLHHHGQPYARVNLNPMSESTLSPSHGLWIWPQGPYIRSIRWGCPWSVPGSQEGSCNILPTGFMELSMPCWPKEVRKTSFPLESEKTWLLAAVKDNNMYCSCVKTTTAVERRQQLWKEDSSCEKKTAAVKRRQHLWKVGDSCVCNDSCERKTTVVKKL